jgi:hypothetical protein
LVLPYRATSADFSVAGIIACANADVANASNPAQTS